MTVHRTLDGDWADCPEPAECTSKIHLPHYSAQQVRALPIEMLLPIVSVFDPPATSDFWHPASSSRQTDVREWDKLVDLMSTASIWLEPREYPQRAPHFHRDHDLPAVIAKDGYREWYQHGYTHREHNRPARILANGGKVWCQEGLFHRTDGPAIDVPGRVEYWLDGVQVEESDLHTWNPRT